jgi:striatin 1/3/4
VSFPYSSKQLSGNASQAVPPAKLAQIQAQAGSGSGGSQKDDAGSHKDGSGGSSPRSEGAPFAVTTSDSLNLPDTAADSPLPSVSIQNGAVSTAPNGRPLTWSGSQWPITNNATAAAAQIGKPAPGRDPKSRAKSRDYLKQ